MRIKSSINSLDIIFFSFNIIKNLIKYGGYYDGFFFREKRGFKV